MLSRSIIPVTALALLGSLVSGGPAAASACPDPDALGTSRTLVIGGAPQVGLKTYPRTLALADHEVVLTFDDGPLAATTPRVLDALKQQCVLATFFLIGRNAAASPGLVRREVAERHSVGHHTWSHPAVTLRGLSQSAALADIQRGISADDAAAFGVRGAALRDNVEPRVPFFRFPGFGDTPELLADLKRRGIAVFGADLWASDWIPMTPDAEVALLMSRVRRAGRGIILLHDIKRQTADMLPTFLTALKREGFHVVHLVPGPDETPTDPAPAGWSSETERTLAHMWPKIQPRPDAKRADVAPAPHASTAVPFKGALE